jgi:hypothetical protein
MPGNPSQSDCWAEFRPYLSQAGEYEVYVCFYADPQNSRKVPHTVYYHGGSTTILVDQKEVKLGTWKFKAGAETRVVVTDATGESYDGYTTLNVDTIKFVYIPPEIIDARIDSYYPNDPSNPVQVEVGKSITIRVTFTNIGNTAWNFIAGATIWDSNGYQVANYEKILENLQLGQQTTVSWTHTVNAEGDYWLQFGIWKEKPYISENLLDKKPSPSQMLIVSYVKSQDTTPPTTGIFLQ